MVNYLKNIIKLKLKEVKALKIAYMQREKVEITQKKQAFVMLAANYNNLGDIAITKAQEQYLKKILPKDYEIIVIPHDKTFNVFLALKKVINEDTIITLIGGGNSGTLYEFIEWPRRFILRHFRDCKIISFPQSVFYDEGKCGQLYKKEFIKLCKKCKNLTLVARENISYVRYKEMFNDNINILLVPDIVFSLKEEVKETREGVSLIFRRDKEKVIGFDREKKLEDECNEKYNIVYYDDTCDVHIQGNGYEDLEQFIANIKTRELVVTDRLHGMIFSYITHTPCIVLDNNNHKIKSTYETWLRNDGKIKLIGNNETVDNVRFNDYHVELQNKFFELKEVILD